jgi:hypothetical protein
MTVNRFLAGDPRIHPDFQRFDVNDIISHGKPARLMPAVVKLIRRMGGLDAIPIGPPSLAGVEDSSILRRDGHHWDAMLKRRDSGDVLVRMRRFKFGKLLIQHWHPHNDQLAIQFRLPVDWTASVWIVETVMIGDSCSTTAKLDLLAAETCDVLVRLVNDPNKTYCHIRRDSFVF